MDLGERLQHAWNAFNNKNPTYTYNYGASYSIRPDRPRFTRGNDRSIVTSVLNRIALDASAIKIEHVKLDEDGRFSEVYDSDLNKCLNFSANIDQTGRAFMQDVVMSMLDEGSIAIVPTDTSVNPKTGAFKIYSLRVGKIVQWYASYVKIRIYNERTAHEEDIYMHKNSVAIVENPLYSVMNEPNSTLQRLIRKINLLDVIDEQSGAGKLDLIIQLPYVVKSPARKEQAEMRRKAIEEQLAGSKYGIAYTDGTERITQLNRSVDNNLMSQVEYLQTTLYSQLGITAEIMNGSADAQTLNNYYNRTIEPILSAIVEEMKRKFLSKTAIAQKQSICFFRDPFKLIPVEQLAEIADKMTRNEIMTSNEIRQEIGMKPSKDPKADELRNSNLSAPAEEQELSPYDMEDPYAMEELEQPM